MTSTFPPAPIQERNTSASIDQDAEGDEEGADREADQQHLEGLADEQDQPDVEALAAIEPGPSPPASRSRRAHLARHAGDQKRGAEGDEEAREDGE